MRFGVIDVGSNTTRLLVAGAGRGGLVPLDKEKVRLSLGEEIEQRICDECWKEWTAAQIRVINHYGLRPALREDREKLYGFTREFLNLAT